MRPSPSADRTGRPDPARPHPLRRSRLPRRPRLPLLTRAALLPLVARGGCDGPSEPELDPGNVDSLLGASVVETDTGVVVNGQWRIRFPHNHSALWLDRFVHYDFGGFPDLGYPQNARHSTGWALMLTHEEARVERNDSVIFRFVDHGAAAVEGAPLDRLTDLPSVTPGARVGFDDFVRYIAYPYHHVAWLGGDETTFHHEGYFDDLAGARPTTLTTTGSPDAGPTTTTFAAAPVATLEELENGAAVVLDDETPPVLSVEHPLAFSFDRPLDPARAFMVFHPLPFQGHDQGALRAFVQPRAATARVVVPADVLAGLVADAAAERVPYLVVIQEVRVADDVFTGSLAGGAGGGAFSLPFVQASQTALLVYIGR